MRMINQVLNLMNITVSKLIFIWFTSLSISAFGATDEEAADRLDISIRELETKRLRMGSLSECPPLPSPNLEGLTDAERTRGMLLWIKRRPERDQHHGTALAGALILNNPALIKDTTELRKILSTTDDLNSFYLVSRMSEYFSTRDENFITEKSRMLFRHGRVAQQGLVDGYSDVLYDVSAFTYESISEYLTYYKFPFDERTMMPHQGMIPTDQKIEILVKWLRENWPGCEKLGLEESPARPVDDKKSESKAAPNQAPRRKPLPASEPNSASSSTNLSGWLGVGLISLIVLVGGAVYLIKRRQNLS